MESRMLQRNAPFYSRPVGLQPRSTHRGSSLSCQSHGEVVRRTSWASQRSSRPRTFSNPATLPFFHKEATLHGKHWWAQAQEIHSPSLPLWWLFGRHVTRQARLWLQGPTPAIQTTLQCCTITFKTALEAAKADETAERGTKDLAGGHYYTICMANKIGTQKLIRLYDLRWPSRPLTLAFIVVPPTLLQHVKTSPTTTVRSSPASVCRKKARDQTENETLPESPDTSSHFWHRGGTLPFVLFPTPRTKPLEVTVTMNN